MSNKETNIPVFNKTLQTTHRWLRDLEMLASLDSEEEAYSVLRAVLHALRNRLPTGEAAQLGAELPMLIRGFYFEGWKPNTAPKKQRSLEAFLAGIQPVPKLANKLSIEEAVSKVFLLLDHRISEGEIMDVRQAMPREVRELWPQK